jgi:hypothetical protein
MKTIEYYTRDGTEYYSYNPNTETLACRFYDRTGIYKPQWSYADKSQTLEEWENFVAWVEYQHKEQVIIKDRLKAIKIALIHAEYAEYDRLFK